MNFFAALQNPLNWIRALGVIAVLSAVGLFTYHYKSISDLAASVPELRKQNEALVAQHSRDDSSAAKAAIQLVANEAAAAQSIRDFDKWNTLRSDVDTSLQDMIRHAPVSTNPSCAPTAADRKLWNAAIDKLTTVAGP